MLRSLDIRDMLIIDRLELSFQSGLNVLTGETGAGKSILLDSLGFVLGWRGRAELVRSGAAQGEVTAVFDLAQDHPARAVLVAAGLPVEDELILRRINTPDGRKTAYINDRRASGEMLRALSDSLVELHGQHDDKGLMDPREHQRILDDFAGLSDDLDRLSKLWRALGAAEKARDAAQIRLAAAREEEDFLRHAAQEIQAMDPQPGEDAKLDADRRLMQGAVRVGEDIAKASDALGLNGAEGQMGDAQRWLEGASGDVGDALEPPLAALATALGALSDAQAGVDRALEALSFNPSDLEDVEERLFAIRALARKHDVLPDELAAFGVEIAQKLAVLDGADADLSALDDAVAQASTRYTRAAEALRAKRIKAAAKLDKSMARELAPLRMERAVFRTLVDPAPASASGLDAVSFRVATNPGAPAGQLNKIASGGELSRFLLALKVCLTQDTSGLTLIFDEIDRGVGGATADAVGRRLAELAHEGQVLVVTHSPQVAALGGHHWRVSKRVEKGQTLSTVEGLGDGARIDEIARMLSGDRITDEARAAARALMQA
ncbi:DNA repair protein RecN [Algirhabdus cladophorae]|uniref:DNA repair protein RecN n=1 Tax=Algirhabdus cladophorae TaxID=3377108 RepID=UPI003B8462DD